MNVIVGVLYALGALAIAATLLPIWKTTRWWVRVCDFPRFQIALIALVIATLIAGLCPPTQLAHWLILGSLLGVVIWQLT